MIIFEEITMRNFFSIGDDEIKIPLNKATPVLVTGHNGAGKSISIVDSICFVLFNKPYKKVNKGDIVNTINGKKCIVSITMNISGTKWKVVRGIKPNIFEIYKNGELLDADSAVKDQQKFLEENVLFLSFETFKQVVILSSTSFIPFMALTTSQRRNIVEDILDIQIFSKMNVIVKDYIKSSKATVHQIDLDIQERNHTVHTIEDIIRGMEQDAEEEIKEAEEELIEQEAILAELKEKADDGRSKFDDNWRKLDFANVKLVGEINKITNDIKYIQNDISSLKSKKDNAKNWINCDTCGQPISEDMRSPLIDKIDENISQLESKVEENKKLLEERKEKAEKVDKLKVQYQEKFDYYTEIDKKVSFAQGTVNGLKSRIKSLRVKAKEKESLLETKKSLVEAQTALDAKKQEFKEETEHLRYLEEILKLLKDDGIKSLVISEYLPIINERINHYLEVLNFFVEFTLDNEFGESIRVGHRDERNYSSLSQGEKQRIDLALLFSWRDIAKKKNSVNTNLLILDETFDSSLDGEGVSNLFSIIESFGNTTNTFVISHRGDILADHFDNQLFFTKKNGFTVLTKEF